MQKQEEREQFMHTSIHFHVLPFLQLKSQNPKHKPNSKPTLESLNSHPTLFFFTLFTTQEVSFSTLSSFLFSLLSSFLFIFSSLCFYLLRGLICIKNLELLLHLYFLNFSFEHSCLMAFSLLFLLSNHSILFNSLKK